MVVMTAESAGAPGPVWPLVGLPPSLLQLCSALLYKVCLVLSCYKRPRFISLSHLQMIRDRGSQKEEEDRLAATLNDIRRSASC